MLHLGKLLNKVVTPQYDLTKTRCIGHAKRSEYCKFNVSNDTSKYDLIHDVKGNYLIRQHKVHCSERPSVEFNILQHNQKFYITEPCDDRFVKIDDKYIFKVKQRYFTFNLLMHLSDITINGQQKSIGIKYIICDIKINVISI